MKGAKLIWILAALLLVSFASALPADVSLASLNGNTLDSNSNNAIYLADFSADINVNIDALADISNAVVSAEVSGNGVNADEDTAAFDMLANTSYSKALTLQLPSDLADGDYNLKLTVSDNAGQDTVMNYGLKLFGPNEGRIIRIKAVKVEGTSLDEDSVNRLELERGDEMEVKVEAWSATDLDDVEIKAFITGYEYNDKERMSDTTHTFDMEANTIYSKKLHLEIPERVDEDSYKLRVVIADRNSADSTFSYNLKIEPKRHYLVIKDILLTPETTVEAGDFLLAGARIKNMGQKDEKSVKVSAAIPGLGISQSTYIDEIEEGDTESSEDIFLTIPECIQAGQYDVVITATYDEGEESTREEAAIYVHSEGCEEDAAEEDAEDDGGIDYEQWKAMVQQQIQNQQPDQGNSSLRNALEISLVVLIVILVVLGIVIGLKKMNEEGELN